MIKIPDPGIGVSVLRALRSIFRMGIADLLEFGLTPLKEVDIIFDYCLIKEY